MNINTLLGIGAIGGAIYLATNKKAQSKVKKSTGLSDEIPSWLSQNFDGLALLKDENIIEVFYGDEKLFKGSKTTIVFYKGTLYKYGIDKFVVYMVISKEGISSDKKLDENMQVMKKLASLKKIDPKVKGKINRDKDKIIIRTDALDKNKVMQVIKIFLNGENSRNKIKKMQNLINEN